MINHIRTLLKNVDGVTSNQMLSPLAEPTSPNFRTRELPSWLGAAHRSLFGINPDTFYRDYRVRELLVLIAASALGDLLTASDPRLTESLLSYRDMPSMKPTLVKNADSGEHTLNCSNDPEADDVHGRSWFHYTIAVASSNATLTTESGVSQVTSPINGVLRVTAPNGLRISIAPTSGTANWTLFGYSRPRGMHPALRNFESQAAPWFDAMVSPETDDYVLARLREVWTKRPEADFPARMSALLLATALYIATLPEKV